MKRSGEKGTRKAGKARRVARSKPDIRLRPPVPLSAGYQRKPKKLSARRIIRDLRWALDNSTHKLVGMVDDLAKMHQAARDALQFYDRAAGNSRADHGWTAADVERVAEIRALVTGIPSRT
jgi:hypothetical protein